MRLKTFTATTMKQAMADIRATVGPDAIIVSNARGRGGRGVTVTVAIERPPRATDDLRRPNPGKPERAAKARAGAGAADGAADRAGISRVVTFHRLPEVLGAHVERAAFALDAEDAAMALAGAFDALFRFAPLPDLPPRPIMLVGPPGSGKTVTVAKLATRALLGGAATRIITTDAARAGGVGQLEAFARLLKCPVETARSPDQLASLLGERKAGAASGGRVTIIDSPGTNPHDDSELAVLADHIAAGDLEPVLTMATGRDARDALFAAEIFAGLGARRTIVTGFDAARRFGDVPAAADAGRLALADFSLSPFVADGLRPFSPATLARLLVTAAGDGALSASLKEANP